MSATLEKKLKPSQFHRRNILRMTIGNLLTDRFYTQNSEFSGSCEFFHKKSLDRCLYLLYYRASLILDKVEIVCNIQGETTPPTQMSPVPNSVASQL